jgi:hypothetical protein
MTLTFEDPKVLPILIKYLADIEWEFVDYSNTFGTKRLFYKNNLQSIDDVVFESYYEQIMNEYGKYCRALLVNRGFFTKLQSLFGLTNKELAEILFKWYKSYTNDDVDFLELMD